MKYCALGDSITYGFIPRNYPGYPGQLKSYAALVAEKLGMEFSNHGISDSTIANLPGHDPMCLRYTQMDNDADLVTVMGGTNDVRCDVPLGTMSDRDNTTFYGGLHQLLGGLCKKYSFPHSTTTKIVVLTPIKLLDASKSWQPDSPKANSDALYKWDEWLDAIREVAAFYNIPVCDLYNTSGINPHLDRTVKGYEEEYTGYYNQFITDGTHPTQEGAELMAQAILSFLKK